MNSTDTHTNLDTCFMKWGLCWPVRDPYRAKDPAEAVSKAVE